ncbi:MAG TPA: hypothetical protein PKJ57_05665, partial [Bacillota bacterium]|nr:hypothetical protein [Bacillota bacterium]
PENVVDSLPPEAVLVVQNRPLMSICSKKPESVVEIEPPLEGKLVENLPFMSICSNKSKRIVQTELLFLRNMAETRLPLPTVSTAVAPSTVMRNNSDQKRS